VVTDRPVTDTAYSLRRHLLGEARRTRINPPGAATGACTWCCGLCTTAQRRLVEPQLDVRPYHMAGWICPSLCVPTSLG